MKFRGWVVAAAAVLLVVGAVCTQAPADTFTERLNNGASCAELFEIRNQEDPSDPVIVEMNEELRRIGCYLNTSERTDT